MRALLVNPWIYDFAAYDLWSKPLGLLMLASHLRRAGCEIGFLDCLDRFHPSLPARPSADAHYGSGPYHTEELPRPALLQEITRNYKRYGLPLGTVTDILAAEERPDIVLVTSGMTYWYPAVRDIISLIKRSFPDVPLILGGNYANLCPAHAAGTSGADRVFRGVSVAEAVAFIDRAARGALLRGRSPGTDRLFPAYELYPTLPYVTLKTSHGCPFRCTYCGWYRIDARFTRQDPRSVVDGIERCCRAFGTRVFAFYDDALLYEAEAHFLKIAKDIVARGIKAAFLTPNGLHNRFISAEVAEHMKAAGFEKPRLALETTSPRRQRETGGKTSNQDFENAVRNLRAAGYARGDIGVTILAGLPGQTADEIETSARVAAAEGLRIHLEEYSPIPGTADYRRAGLPPDADPLLHNNSVFPLHDHRKREELQRLKDTVHHLNDLQRLPPRS